MDHREFFEEMSPEDWARWRHHPVTAAFLHFLEDQLAVYREAAADMVEFGNIDVTAMHEAVNPHVVRGRIATTRELIELKLEVIQEAYREERERKASDDSSPSAAD